MTFDQIWESIKGCFASQEQKLDALSEKLGKESAQLSAANAEIAQLKADLATSKQTIGTLQTQLVDQANALKVALDAKDKEVEAKASARALEIVAKQGVPAAAASLDGNIDGGKKIDPSLKGRDRTVAAFNAQLRASGYIK